jgi:hypothetical protein
MPHTPLGTASMSDLAAHLIVLNEYRDEWPPDFYDHWRTEVRRRAWWLLSRAAA